MDLGKFHDCSPFSSDSFGGAWYSCREGVKQFRNGAFVDAGSDSGLTWETTPSATSISHASDNCVVITTTDGALALKCTEPAEVAPQGGKPVTQQCTHVCWEQISPEAIWTSGTNMLFPICLVLVVAIILIEIGRVFKAYVTDDETYQAVVPYLFGARREDTFSNEAWAGLIVQSLFVAFAGLVITFLWPLLALVGFIWGVANGTRWCVRLKKKVDKLGDDA